MGKWDDDIPLRPRGSVEPASVSALLRSLKVTDASEPKQRAAISEWVQHHNPSPLMVHSLRRKGFSELLDNERQRKSEFA